MPWWNPRRSLLMGSSNYILNTLLQCARLEGCKCKMVIGDSRHFGRPSCIIGEIDVLAQPSAAWGHEGASLPASKCDQVTVHTWSSPGQEVVDPCMLTTVAFKTVTKCCLPWRTPAADSEREQKQEARRGRARRIKRSSSAT